MEFRQFLEETKQIQWKLNSEKNGLRIKTNITSGFVDFYFETVVPFDVETISGFAETPSLYPKWLPFCDFCELIEERTDPENPNSKLIYLKLSWSLNLPKIKLKEKYAIIELRVNRVSPENVLIHIEQVSSLKLKSLKCSPVPRDSQIDVKKEVVEVQKHGDGCCFLRGRAILNPHVPMMKTLFTIFPQKTEKFLRSNVDFSLSKMVALVESLKGKTPPPKL